MHRVESILLINAGNDEGMCSIANDHSFPALGVLALGTWLNEKVPSLQVIVRDGGVRSQAALIDEIQRLRPDLVGISVLSTSYQASLQLATVAKESGALVVLGNDQASQLGKNILRNRPYVDFVIGSEYGEEALQLLIEGLRAGTDLSEVPHLVYRMNGEIVGFEHGRDKSLLSITKSALFSGKTRKNVLDMFPIVDRTLYPADHWKQYRTTYLEKFESLHANPITGVTTMNRARGCSRQGNAICKHCDMLLDVSFSSADIFWHEVRSAYQQVGANVLYEVCDSFSSFGQFVSDVARTKPHDLGFDPAFFVYAQALDIVERPRMVDELAEIGVFRVNVGLESGSDTTLKQMKGARDSVANNYAALTLLKKKGIHVYASFVLGTEPETEATLTETIRWMKLLVDEGLVCNLEAQPVLPLPNNFYGRQLKAAGLFPAGPSNDWPINTDAIAQAYIGAFSGITYDRAMDAVREIKSYANPRGVSCGSAFLNQAD